VSDEVRQCVVYLGLPAALPEGEMRMKPVGTAFFVGIPAEGLENWNYSYLVTARHVAQRLEGREFLVRVNLKDGGATFVRSGQGLRWWYHPSDATVDAALFPWAPPKTVEYRMIPTEMFLTDEVVRSKSIGAGDEVFMTGLFAHYAGNQRNIPIVRMGSIAMMPHELVPTSLGNIDAYLIEARSIGGLSGSPAFVRETVLHGLGSSYLLGLMHGHWDIPPEAINDSPLGDYAEEQHGRVNMGIAIVVPAKKILEVMNQQQLVDIRRDLTEQEKLRRQPPLPSPLAG